MSAHPPASSSAAGKKMSPLLTFGAMGLALIALGFIAFDNWISGPSSQNTTITTQNGMTAPVTMAPAAAPTEAKWTVTAPVGEWVEVSTPLGSCIFWESDQLFKVQRNVGGTESNTWVANTPGIAIAKGQRFQAVGNSPATIRLTKRPSGKC